MSKSASQKYSYANNSNGELIKVTHAQRDKQYFCPICGSQMIPHIGKVRRWHFVHKNVENCSYESYLHTLAKFKFREAFLSSEHFLLSYDAKALCSCSCPFIDSHKCEGRKSVEFDLLKYYDTCLIEAPYHKYKADLLLNSSVNPNLPPVLIEIMVTHKCTEDKISDGVRIIEIPVHSEDQIENIVNNCKIVGIRAEDLSNSGQITLYNFNKIESYDPADSSEDYEYIYDRKDTIVFWLNKQGQFQTFDCHCYEVDKLLPKNVHYFVTNIATPFKEIFQWFSQHGVRVRNCFLCKFSKQDYKDQRICVLYKKHGLPRKPSPYNATKCPHYKEDDVQQSSLYQKDRDVEDSGYRCYYHICDEIL